MYARQYIIYFLYLCSIAVIIWPYQPPLLMTEVGEGKVNNYLNGRVDKFEKICSPYYIRGYHYRGRRRNQIYSEGKNGVISAKDGAIEGKNVVYFAHWTSFTR